MRADRLDALIVPRSGWLRRGVDVVGLLRRAGIEPRRQRRGAARGLGRIAVSRVGPVEVAIGPPVTEVLLRLMDGRIPLDRLTCLAVSHQENAGVAMHTVVVAGQPGRSLSIAGTDHAAREGGARLACEDQARREIAAAWRCEADLISRILAAEGRGRIGLARSPDGRPVPVQHEGAGLWRELQGTGFAPTGEAFTPGAHVMEAVDLACELHLAMIRHMVAVGPGTRGWADLEDGAAGVIYDAILPR